MELWNKGKSLESLSVALRDAAAKGWIVVVDSWTPATVREKVTGTPRLARIPAPSLEREMLTQLNDFYLAIWNASGRRVNPHKP
jgi:hypothetical protein